MDRSGAIQLLRAGAEGVEEWNRIQRGPEPILDLREVDLDGADLRGFDLSRIRLSDGSLVEAKLDGARLDGAVLARSRLDRASLVGASLVETIVVNCSLKGANFQYATFDEAVLSNLDLSECLGLETVRHRAPSDLGISCLVRSRVRIPEEFLRGSGVPEPLIMHLPSILQSINPVSVSSCYLSYSIKDQEFADRLYQDLRDAGIRCWYAPAELEPRHQTVHEFGEAVRILDKQIVVISSHSLNSPWVEQEVQKAMERERTEGRSILFAIRIDHAIYESRRRWARKLLQTHFIGDFEDRDPAAYKQAVSHLIRGLSLSLASEASRPEAAP